MKREIIQMNHNYVTEPPVGNITTQAGIIPRNLNTVIWLSVPSGIHSQGQKELRKCHKLFPVTALVAVVVGTVALYVCLLWDEANQ